MAFREEIIFEYEWKSSQILTKNSRRKSNNWLKKTLNFYKYL